MNVSTTTLGTLWRRPHVGGVQLDIAALLSKLGRRVLRMPLLLWSLVVAAALLAFFVHLLNAQILRGEKLREEQRAAATRPVARLALAADLEHPANALIVTRQPMTRP